MAVQFKPAYRFADIVTALQTRLIAAAVVPASNITIIAEQQAPSFRRPYALYLRARGMNPDNSYYRGGGRREMVVSRIVDVVLQLRDASDSSDTDLFFLTKEKSGLFDLEESTANALLEPWFPIAPNGTAMVVRPLQLLRSDDPRRTANRPIFGDSFLSFDLTYQMLLTLPEKR